MVSGRAALGLRWFRRGGLCHTRGGDAWRGYEGKTAELPDANLRAISVGKGPPTVDLGWARSNGWWQGRGGGRLRDGAGEYSNMYMARRGVKTLG